MNATIFRSAINIAAISGIYLSVAMLIPAFIDVYYGHPDSEVFFLSAFMTGGLSLATAAATRSGPPPFNKRMGFLVVNMLWLSGSVIGAIPLWLSSLDLTFAQAFFESVSAISTTGSTVIIGLDDAPPGVLMWRSLLHWLGGVGILALGLFIKPYLRVGGMSFFKLESSDTADKPFARIASYTRAFLAIYVAITLICAIVYAALGMSRFDALNHAMSTVATGGLSTHDASFGYFGDNLVLLWSATLFMIIGSLPFSIMILFAVRRRVDTLRDPQILVFIGYVSAFAFVTAVYVHFRDAVPFSKTLAHAFFNFASIFSTTGFASQDYTAWGPLVVVAAFIATFVGGCSGSTAGGIKAYRFLIMFQTMRVGLKKLLYPDAIYSVRYGKLTVDLDTQRGVLLFFAAYMMIWAFGVLGMGALGYDFATAVSASITAIANVGPGIGQVIGPAGNFASMSDGAFYLLSLLMLLGRLEILSILVLLLPTFWRA